MSREKKMFASKPINVRLNSEHSPNFGLRTNIFGPCNFLKKQKNKKKQKKKPKKKKTIIINKSDTARLTNRLIQFIRTEESTGQLG